MTDDENPPPPPPTVSAPVRATDGQKGTTTHYVLPTGRSPWAIAAGYLGLLSLIPIVHLAAVVTGVLGLRQIAANDRLAGKGRAWLGIVLGSVFTVLYGAAIVLG